MRRAISSTLSRVGRAWLVIAVAGATVLACWRFEPTCVAEGAFLPPFSLVNWDGRPITPETLRGKHAVIAFTYAKCELACPIVTSQLKSLDATLESPPDVVYFHVSVNPTEDTPAEIHRHFTAHGIDPEKDTRWLFARGSVAAIAEMLDHFEIRVEKKSVAGAELIEHTIRVWVVDRAGRLIKQFDSYLWDEEEMKHALES